MCHMVYSDVLIGKKRKTQKRRKIQDTRYRVQYPVFIPNFSCMEKKKGTQFFASLFLPHCEVDGYSIRGAIIAAQRK